MISHALAMAIATAVGRKCCCLWLAGLNDSAQLSECSRLFPAANPGLSALSAISPRNKSRRGLSLH